MNRVVLDASAVLAFINDEVGSSTIDKYLALSPIMSAVNWAEVVSKAAEVGYPPEKFQKQLRVQGPFRIITIKPFTEQDSIAAANLRESTKSQGLSLADRACLALAKRLNLPVLTADRIWGKLNLGIEIIISR